MEQDEEDRFEADGDVDQGRGYFLSLSEEAAQENAAEDDADDCAGDEALDDLHGEEAAVLPDGDDVADHEEGQEEAEGGVGAVFGEVRSEEHTSELQSPCN